MKIHYFEKSERSGFTEQKQRKSSRKQVFLPVRFTSDHRLHCICFISDWGIALLQLHRQPEVIEAYKKIYGLIWDKKVSPTPAFSKSVSGQFGDPFLSGKIGMSIVGSWSLAASSEFNFKVGVAAVPQGPNEKIRSVLYVDPLFVLKDSMHPKEAYEWIKYLVTTDVQEKSIELSGGNPPVNQKAAEKYYANFEGIEPKQIK
ncbi:extracellular solute-binding protein [Paenibacillus andongensis]|uniref:extracellular solute-binding protein n=1 Tax=Paenibacillus andongensis TaxID=2975482 RepID=UPI0021BAA3EE|nr:extracellular solute-binding protein [Paenibacillus andongensis]